MEYRTRKIVKPEDLNPRNILFGGRMLAWVDEECFIYAACQLDTSNLVTKLIGEVNFEGPAHQGDIVEIGVETVAVGNSSITLACEVRNKTTRQPILRIGKVVFVHVDEHGKSQRHKLSSLNDTAVS